MIPPLPDEEWPLPSSETLFPSIWGCTYQGLHLWLLRRCHDCLRGAVYTSTLEALSQRCQDCFMAVDTLGPSWPSSSPPSRAAFTRRHTEVNQAIRLVLLQAGYDLTLELLLLNSDLQEGNPGLRADQLVYRIDPTHSCLWPVHASARLHSWRGRSFIARRPKNSSSNRNSVCVPQWFGPSQKG